jgi:L-ascorbate metabolism protein UlaG (beta-lactamase superfamily)
MVAKSTNSPTKCYQMKIRTEKVLITLATLVLVGCVAAPGYEGKPMDNFDGKIFINSQPMQKSLTDLLKLGWEFTTKSDTWPEELEITPQLVPQERVAQGISVTFVNHATVLIQVDGLNILTDPVYAERASPFSFAGPKRIHQPGIRLEDLPPIDVILISHNHYDHLDTETLTQLVGRQQNPPRILTGLGNSALLDRVNLSNHAELNWNDSEANGDINFTFTECRHRSGRGITDQMKTLWGSFVIEAPSGNIYFAGDTGYDGHFKAAQAKYGGFALSILPIGAYEPRWFMKDVHLNPAEAVQAHLDLNSEQSLSIHFGTFQLTLESIDQPVKDLKAALIEKQLSEKSFLTLQPGDTRVIKAR